MLLPTCNLCRHWMGASTSDMAVEHPWESFADQQTAAVNTGTWHHMAICAWGNAPNSCSQSHVTYQDLAKPNPQKWTIPTNTSNLYSQIRYDLPRIGSLWPHFPAASCCMPPQIKGTSLRKHACSRAKVVTAPMHRNAGSCWTSAHFGGNQQNPGNMCEHMGKPRISQHFTMESQAPGPHDGPQVVQHVLLGQKAMDTVDAKACHGCAPGPGSGHRCRRRKRRRPTKPSWALQGLHGVLLLLGRKCGPHISILYHLNYLRSKTDVFILCTGSV